MQNIVDFLKINSKLWTNQVPSMRYHHLSNNLLHRVNNFEKRILVWAGKYEKFADVPDFIRPNKLQRCKSLMRIRVTNGIMLAGGFGCILMVLIEKAEAKKRNTEWQKKFYEDSPISY